MTITFKTGTRLVPDKYEAGDTNDQDTVEAWIGGIRFTTDVDSPAAGRALIERLSAVLPKSGQVTSG